LRLTQEERKFLPLDEVATTNRNPSRRSRSTSARAPRAGRNRGRYSRRNSAFRSSAISLPSPDSGSSPVSSGSSLSVPLPINGRTRSNAMS
jgi:hypothetical protein